MLVEKSPASPYINRFLQPDTIIPDLSNPQSWNRYSYVTNRPVNFNDPTGHAGCDGDYQGSCADWAKSLKHPDQGGGPDDELSGNGDESATGLEEFYDVMDYVAAWNEIDPYYVDAKVMSFNFVMGIGNWYQFIGLDVVISPEAIVPFFVYGDDLTLFAPGVHPFAAPESVALMSPQFGVTASWGNVNSAEIRLDPTRNGVINAYSGTSKQQGAGVSPLGYNAFSSADPVTGKPDFKTFGDSIGISIGFPDIFAEYHTYYTDAQPIILPRLPSLP